MSLLFFLLITIHNISSGFSSTYKDGYAGRVEINIKSNHEDQVNLIKSDDIELLKRDFPSGDVSYLTEMDGVLGVENVGYPVKAVLSGENLDKFSAFTILRGTFFSSDQYKYGKKVAVISETLAQKLFTTNKVIGNQIKILGINYKIIGLYQNKNSIISLFAADGMERVYIPFDSIAKSDNQTINTVFISDKVLDYESFRVHKLENIIRDRLTINSNSYKITDFYDGLVFTSQPLSAFIFLIGIFSIYILIKYFIKYLRFGLSYLKNGIESNYFLQILVKWKLRILVFFVVAMMILIFIRAVFWLISFKGIIPYEYIPTDNIFDFGFYADIVKDAIYIANISTGYAPTQLESLFKNNLMIIYMLMLFLIINFLSIISNIKLSKIVSESSAKRMMVLAVSLCIGLIMSFVFCMVSGLKYYFPVREVGVMGLFFSGILINEKKVVTINNNVFKSNPEVY
jgi:putative ABC transport system permease protein